MLRRHWLPALVVFLVVWVVLLPSVLDEPQFLDENFYVWSGSYYLGRLAQMSVSPTPGTDTYRDPGFDPDNWWSRCAPFPFRLFYGLTTLAAGAEPPAEPAVYPVDPKQTGAIIPPRTLLAARLGASLCAALGLAALALRFGWSGVAAATLMLAMPLSCRDLSRAMAEGPLVGALGLCVLAFGSRWLPIAAALAVGAKLSALPLWVLPLWPRALGVSRWRAVWPAMLAPALWTAIHPASWFAGGPLYLVPMLALRAAEQAKHSATLAGGGLYLPSWYLVPVKYAVVVALAYLLPRSRFWPKAAPAGDTAAPAPVP
jgi:hypothetical protein